MRNVESGVIAHPGSPGPEHSPGPEQEDHELERFVASYERPGTAKDGTLGIALNLDLREIGV